MLESHGEELSAGNLIQLEKQIMEEEEETPTPEPKAFPRQGLTKGFAEIQQALAILRPRILTWKGSLGFPEAS